MAAAVQLAHFGQAGEPSTGYLGTDEIGRGELAGRAELALREASGGDVQGLSFRTGVLSAHENRPSVLASGGDIQGQSIGVVAVSLW